MRTKLLFFLMIFSMTLVCEPVLAKRHHKAQTETVKKDTSALEAFSDTTSLPDSGVVTSVDTVDAAEAAAWNDDVEDRNLALGILGTIIGGSSFALILGVLFIVVLIFILPFIMLILLLRYLVRRHNDNVIMERERVSAYRERTAQEERWRNEHPQQYEESRQSKETRESSVPSGSANDTPRTSNDPKNIDEYRDKKWDTGVRNIAVGVGLIALFYFMGADELVGVGVLVACLGAGQMFLGRYRR